MRLHTSHRSNSRPPLALILAGAVCFGAYSCGGGDPARPTVAAPAAARARALPPGGYLKVDGDGDYDEHRPGPSNDDQGEMVAAGHSSTDAERRAVTAVVKRYFAAASGGEGAAGCTLLDAGIVQYLPREQGRGGPSCAVALSALFREQRARLVAEEVATMVVTSVDVAGDVGRATLGFRAAPESEIAVQRDGRAWRVDALFDSPLP